MASPSLNVPLKTFAPSVLLGELYSFTVQFSEVVDPESNAKGIVA